MLHVFYMHRPYYVSAGLYLSCLSCTGPIVSLSLAGPCAMEFRRGGEQRALFLPPRSLLVMADEARYAWHHYIPHRRSDPLDGQAVPRAASRVSFTFRKVRRQRKL